MAKTALGFFGAYFFLVLTIYSQSQPILRYNYEYICNKERVVVGRCRHDSDMPGVVPTSPENDYCQVIYPDRPKRDGFTVETVELRRDVIGKLSACNAFAKAETGKPSNAPMRTDGNKVIDGELTTAKSLVESALSFRKANNEAEALRQFNLAINKYKEIITRYPDASKAYLGLGGIYMNQLRNYDLALPVWTKLRKLTPNDSSIAILVGQTMYGLKRYDESIQTFREALAANPDADMQAIVHVYLNYIYADRKQYDRAVHEDLEAIKADPNYANAYHSLGMAYYSIGDYTKAIDAFQKALRNNYSPPEQSYNWIGYIYIEQKMYDKALPFLNETYRSKPDYPNTSNNLGNAYFGLGRYADAASAYQRAIQLAPNDAQYNYNLGYAYVMLGKKAEAMQIYNSLKKIDAKKAEDLLIEINKT